MMNLSRYTADRKEEWDALVRSSRNGTFLLERSYMDYHSDRFRDHSLMFRNDKGILVAVLPANEDGDMFYSHQGLTYGGFILSVRFHAKEVGELFTLTVDYLREKGFRKFIYKSIPHIYHTLPAEEDEYWLWRMGAKHVSALLSTTVCLTTDAATNKRMTRATKLTDHNRLQHLGFTVDWHADVEEFWRILSANLMKHYNVAPVHTVEEMKRLMKAFPENIICVSASDENGFTEAGVLLFVTPQAVHTQYISAAVKGKKDNVLDFLLLEIIDHFRREGSRRYFDFGHSNDHVGGYLNETLLLQKEGFGGRGVVYRQFSLTVG